MAADTPELTHMTNQFAASIERAADLVKTRAAFLLLAPPYELDLVYVDVKEARASVAEISWREFGQHVSRICEYLGALLAAEGSESEAAMSARLKRPGRHDASVAEELGLVKQKLYNAALQERYDLKQSSKAPSFSGVDWDVKIKVDDAALNLHPSPYATVRIRVQRDFATDLYSLFGGRKFESLQLNFSIEEVDFLRAVLGRVRESLSTARQAEATESDQ